MKNIYPLELLFSILFWIWGKISALEKFYPNDFPLINFVLPNPVSKEENHITVKSQYFIGNAALAMSGKWRNEIKMFSRQFNQSKQNR